MRFVSGWLTALNVQTATGLATVSRAWDPEYVHDVTGTQVEEQTMIRKIFVAATLSSLA